MEIQIDLVDSKKMLYDGDCIIVNDTDIQVAESIFKFIDIEVPVECVTFTPALFDTLYVTNDGLVLLRDKKKFNFSSTYTHYEIIGFFDGSVWHHRKFASRT